MSHLLKNKVILVTGGAQGIGQECAFAYSREGAHVVIADIKRELAEKTVNKLTVPGLSIECDVTDETAVRNAIRYTLDTYKKLDGVHNNAGYAFPSKSLDQTTNEEWQRIHDINLKSVLYTTRHSIDALKKSKGAIVNTASMVGLNGQKNHAAYVATKGGLIALTKAMAVDYAPFKIRVNAVAPAGVLTPMLEDWINDQEDPQKLLDFLDDIHPLGDCPRGDVVADASVFLMSNLARFITGCILPVSGGAELDYK